MIQKIYNYFWSKDKYFIRNIRELLGFVPTNLFLFKQAFIHKGSNHNSNNRQISNERLEFLGDALLSTIIAEYLYKKYLHEDEGFLTKMRAKIVQRKTLNRVAEDLGLDIFLKQYNQLQLSDSMMGNALEALIGAIYIEKGYNFTRNFVVVRILQEHLDVHSLEKKDENFKSRLLEWCQKNGKVLEYELMEKYRQQKRDRFKVAVIVDEEVIANGSEFNKKGAEQIASKKAMVKLGLLKKM
ncbi:ribonuclease III [Membranihabitans maritimus]|uniref:ribonuclease III n=1 Tax=Membranihabitans maritimus TaxID=2904244 RepID=UPI001F0011AB|nr:ribonuclease III [Membranihabitans maritimus]